MAIGSSVAGRIIPIARAAIFNTDLPIAETDWLASVITPIQSPSYLRLYVAVATAGVLRATRIVSGVRVIENLNSGASLIAHAAYIFDIEWRAGDSLNFRYSVAGDRILVFRADEVGNA